MSANVSKFEYIVNFVGHYKYLVVFVLGLAFVVFLGDNSMMQNMKLDEQRSDLKNEIDRLKASYEDDANKLEELEHSGNTLERVARERYFMKRADEDVFVLSIDLNKEL